MVAEVRALRGRRGRQVHEVDALVAASELHAPAGSQQWEYEGTSDDSAKVKAERKAERLAAGSACRYVRGLRVFIQDQGTTKFVDRDVNGSVNIGLLWISDNIQGRSRPKVFVRPKESVAKKTAEITRMSLPAQNSG